MIAPAHGPAWLGDSKVCFRLWAPDAKTVALWLEGREHAMQEEDGWYSVTTAARAGEPYHFIIDGADAVPDPAARRQCNDGNSELVEPGTFAWHDQHWHGRSWAEAVIYELHIGTFSERGDFTGVTEKLEALKDLGITAIELMPIAHFAGARGWGYDGVQPYAIHTAYGTADELKRLIDRAHALGLMVLLDVVYNHFGPSGNFLPRYAKRFFTDRATTPWGDAIDFTQAPVRQFFIDNARYWLDEFHFDGLRFDAVHAIVDPSPSHFLEELAQTLREDTSPGHHCHLILENEHNEARYLAPQQFNAQWNDDIHHVLHVLTTGETEGYYEDYAREPLQKLGRALTEGFVYQGEGSPHRDGAPRGEASKDLPPAAFVAFTQNHDQIGNRALGERLSVLAEEPMRRLAMAILCLSPQIPLLFMGEEWASRQPFYYFCDFAGELADAVRDGRRKEFAKFAAFADEKKRSRIPDPNSEKTFWDSRLHWHERELAPYHKALAETQMLLAVRQKEILPLLRAGIISANATIIEDLGLEVNWHCADKKILSLTANFSPVPVRAKAASTARVIWGAATPSIPPYQSLWTVADHG